MFITFEVIENQEISELDFVNQSNFGFSYDEYYQLTEIIIGKPRVTTEPILIDSIIDKLQKIKERGSNYVSLDYHCDHISYEMTGYKVYPSQEDQILSFIEKRDSDKQKQRKIMELYQEIKTLKEK